MQRARGGGVSIPVTRGGIVGGAPDLKRTAAPAMLKLAQPRRTPALIEGLEQEDRSRILLEAVTFLPERLRQIVIARFGLDGAGERQLREIGDVMALSKERVRQLEEEALQMLFAMLEDLL
jgi:DNA-directed RNA polymerase sigma subunit (sigma70/sigma32)